GFQAAGAVGGVIATLGEVTPSVIIIILIARFLTAFDKNQKVKDAFYGLRPAVVALITYALLKLMGVTLLNGGAVLPIETVLYAVLVCCVLVWKKVHPIIWILAGAVAGLLFQLPS
ncbi:MAG: chromate transporter, partial [Sphaerochaeta sp.]|nr:chromate transporter [Sphaerochaeta sp.]